ncbi:MAG: alanyl-tRNA editing protein [Candidatus Nanoarchaeia archaeon]|nr:alanyl-tRNA editing protein [Candidatus Nanoarchaeia archaeon]
MTDQVYLDDSYLKELEAEIVSVDGNKVVLDKTIFYATGGGQPNDVGVIVKDDLKFVVSDVKKEEGEIIHYVEGSGLPIGDKVICKIDWERRYKLMRTHTAAHVLAAAIAKKTNAMITGGELGLDKSKMDFSVDELSNEQAQEFVKAANEALAKNLDINTYYKTREEFKKDPSLVKLAKGFPEHIQKVRIVAIGDYDIQADGGTHVKNTKEVGKINLIKIENKGKGRKRIYYSID